MPLEQAIAWDPENIVSQAMLNEDWINVSVQTKRNWVRLMNSGQNDDTFISKLIDFECFLAIVIRDSVVRSQIIVLADFHRFTKGPIFYGPYNWPDPKM